MRKIAIFGGTGFIGRALYEKLAADYELYIITRNTEKAEEIFGHEARIIEWNKQNLLSLSDKFNGFFAFINLIGENIGTRLWTVKQKERLLQSRLNTARSIVKLVNSLESKPEVLIQASAIGYYGNSYSELFTEASANGFGFMATLTGKWESELEEIEQGNRVVVIRSGIVLGNNGGFMKTFMIPFRLFLGGYFGNGKQWMSWIHIEDEVLAIKHLIENAKTEGVYNLTSPEPVVFKEFSKALGKSIRRPSWTKVPAFLLRVVFGEMADEVLLASQKVIPENLVRSGYEFRYNRLVEALNNINTI